MHGFGFWFVLVSLVLLLLIFSAAVVDTDCKDRRAIGIAILAVIAIDTFFVLAS